jgi:hypothetical protein
MKRSRALVLSLLAGIAPALLIAARPANAGGGYYVRWNDVPDLDQRRSENCPGHPGLCQSGDNFCGPASCTDWFAFINNHYTDFMSTPNVDWQNTHYNLVTQTIDHAASHCFAGLDVCHNGTAFGKIDDCLRDHLGEYGINWMTVQADCEGDDYIGPQDIALWMMAMGGLPVAEIGWYEFVDNQQWKMRLGHFVPIIGVWDQDNNDISAQITFHDPDDSNGNLCTQSVFVDDITNATREWVTISHLFQIGYDHRYQYKLEGVKSGNKQGFLNNYTALCTFFAVGFPDRAADPALKLIQLPSHDSDPNPPVRQFDLADFGGLDNIADVKLHPLLPAVAVRVKGAATHPGALWMFDAVRGWAPLCQVAGEGHMAFGRRGELYVTEGTRLSMLRVDPRERRATVVRGLDLPRPPDALAFDEAADMPVALDSAGGQLLTFPKQLQGGIVPVRLSADLARAAAAPGAAAMTFDPVTQTLWLAKEGQAVVNRLGPGPKDTSAVAPSFKLPGSFAPESLCFSDRGNIVAWMNGDIAEFTRDATGRLTRLERSPWSGRGFGPKFCLARSHSAADPVRAMQIAPNGTMTDVPRAVAPCPADLTGPEMDGMPDGVLGDEDRAMFMQLWMSGDPRADLDDGSATGRQDRRVDDADLAYFLEKLGNGC